MQRIQAAMGAAVLAGLVATSAAAHGGHDHSHSHGSHDHSHGGHDHSHGGHGHDHGHTHDRTAAILHALQHVHPAVLKGVSTENAGSYVELIAAPTKGFSQLADATGLPWTSLFPAYRASRRYIHLDDPRVPEGRLRFLRVELPKSRDSRPRYPKAPGIPEASFFDRMPMDDWHTPADGTFAVPRAGGRRRHKGIDMHAPEGTPIYAVAAGLVVRAWNSKGKDRDGGYGNYVILQHAARDSSGMHYWTYYTHMRDNPDVQEGYWVRSGRQLGTVGRTPIGRFDNPHLHFEVRHGDGTELGAPVNPTPFGPFRERFHGGEGAF